VFVRLLYIITPIMVYLYHIIYLATIYILLYLVIGTVITRTTNTINIYSSMYNTLTYSDLIVYYYTHYTIYIFPLYYLHIFYTYSCYLLIFFVIFIFFFFFIFIFFLPNNYILPYHIIYLAVLLIICPLFYN
jgi:hypothetical protein